MPQSKFGIRLSSTDHDQQPYCCSGGGSRGSWTCFWGYLRREELVYLFIFPRNALVGLSIIVIARFIMAEVFATKRLVHSEIARICLSCHQLLSVEDPEDKTDWVREALFAYMITNLLQLVMQLSSVLWAAHLSSYPNAP